MCLCLFFQPDTSSVAVALAKHYEAARLSIDAVVTDALINGTSPVSLKARELCDSAVAKTDERKTVETGEHEPCTHTHTRFYADTVYTYKPEKRTIVSPLQFVSVVLQMSHFIQA